VTDSHATGSTATPIAQRRPYTLMKRLPIHDTQEMGKAADRTAAWHILDRRGAPMCDRIPADRIAQRAPYRLVKGKWICGPCHGQFSWSPMPHDVERVDRGYETLCLVWTRGQSARGYGKRQHAGKNTPTHIQAWEAVNGSVPAGHVLHHACEQKDCLDWRHMRVVTRAEHVALHRRTFDYAALATLYRLGGLSRKELATYFGVKPLTIKAALERMKKRGEL
jgi:hypothetical protein